MTTTTTTTTTEFERRAAIASGAIRADFGEGWMTSAARDMIRMAAFAGFDVQDLVKRVAMTANPDRTTNAATIGRVMDEMYAETAPEKCDTDARSRDAVRGMESWSQ